MMHKTFVFFCFFILLSCSDSRPRRPINPKPSATRIQTNIKTSKQLIAWEENEILDFISKDSLVNYEISTNGFWYAYKNKIENQTATPKTGDIVEFQYDIRSLNDSILYSKTVLGIKKYKVDKEDFISGIQKGIKLMKVGETITFVIPSYNAFGVSGDGNKVKMHTTIKSTITLLNIIN
ncbi:MAG: gliding motility-associated peptidyl-prolyl isomerase GldI [Flavobacteriales bacterium]|jgi:gliding motility-associated peptidyl-prolyl isomerase|tara:strand:+ start:5322 stop:5858 length:537 start_codon:yes stop_codon:yes gene_type:complete